MAVQALYNVALGLNGDLVTQAYSQVVNQAILLTGYDFTKAEIFDPSGLNED
jgi:hypothetical protein